MTDPLAKAQQLSQHGFRFTRLADEITERAMHEQVRSGGIDIGTPGLFTFTLPHEAGELLVRAEACCSEALRVLPKGDIRNLTVLHHQLGTIYKQLGDRAKARFHLQQAIRLDERINDRFRAAQSHQDMAHLILHRGGRVAEALDHARAAARLFEETGRQAHAEKARTLVQMIDDMLT